MSGRYAHLLAIDAIRSLLANLVADVEVKPQENYAPDDADFLRICVDGISDDLRVIKEGLAGYSQNGLACSLDAALSLNLTMFNVGSILSKFSPQTAAAVRRAHIERVRPKRQAPDEERIEAVLRKFDPDRETAFKFAQSAAQELKDLGVEIGERTIRRRLAKLDSR